MSDLAKKPQDAKKIAAYIAPLVLIADVIIASFFWFFRESILPGQDTNIAIICGFIVFSGLVVFMFIRNLSRKVL